MDVLFRLIIITFPVLFVTEAFVRFVLLFCKYADVFLENPEDLEVTICRLGKQGSDRMTDCESSEVIWILAFVGIIP